MKLIITSLLLFVSVLQAEQTWHVLFDGENLAGWQSNEETLGVFSITEDGALKVEGGRAHLFWMGTEAIPAEFKNFELKMSIMTMEGANSGVFFHTKYQDEGWPEYGLEAQVNSTHKDRRKTGSIWDKRDVLDDAPSVDGEWCTYAVRVDGRAVVTSVNGEIVNVYVEPEAVVPPKNRPFIRLGEGTFAIQGHDPKSVTFYKDIKVRSLD